MLRAFAEFLRELDCPNEWQTKTWELGLAIAQLDEGITPEILRPVSRTDGGRPSDEWRVWIVRSRAVLALEARIRAEMSHGDAAKELKKRFTALDWLFEALVWRSIKLNRLAYAYASRVPPHAIEIGELMAKGACGDYVVSNPIAHLNGLTAILLEREQAHPNQPRFRRLPLSSYSTHMPSFHSTHLRWSGWRDMGGRQLADAIDSYLIGKVARLAVGYVRDPGIWLMKRRGRHGLCRRCNGEGKGDTDQQSDHCFLL